MTTSPFVRGLAARIAEGTPADRFASPLDLALAVDPKLIRTPALDLVNEALVWMERTPDARLIVTMAPQESKSTTCVRFGALWALSRNPDRRVAITSYADRLARRWGRRIRNDILTHSGGRGVLDLGLRLAPDQQAANEWELDGSDGGVYTAGVGGSLTGRQVSWLLIDDPVKDRKQADSRVFSEDVWEWWESTASTRLAPGAPVCLVMTRWRHDDLAGRLMASQPGVWRVVHIPAQADPDLIDPDPLGRAPGEFMASAQRRTQAQWEQRKQDAGDEWEAMYQGNPRAPGGAVFDVSRIRYWSHGRSAHGEAAVACGQQVWPLDQCWRFATIDTAMSTRTSADWTVASAWAIPPDGSLVLLDVVRERLPPHKQIDAVLPLVDRFDLERVKVEPNMKSTELVRELAAEGLRVEDAIADRSKELRAAPAARRVERGQVWFPSEHRLLEVILKEVSEFPNGRHDDFVDTLSYAATTLFEEWVPPSSPARRPTRSPRNEFEQTLENAMEPALDYDRVQW